ncbi:TonB-dependent receptor [Altererythrobacter soli]|uniref:TonB-dependent receptor n=1 Tax=Croceibacterium soli TaxID=1739690 RepID=A0A6I4UWL1_9SPHN|nr:TonB-dependent receptor [Croceibacterium soli]MXP41807.1 TonB-dependent receptor [Croceibacterium soli]
MRLKYLAAASTFGLSAASMFAAPATAQSTGSVEFEENEIVVTGAFERGIGGVELPDTAKAKQVLDQEIIRRQRPGQTINDSVNLVPGVSFQNNDPWGSGGGSFTIRGFASDRVSQTLDGLPLNDSGNYALYTNQQVDSEILEEVNVNLGVTDIDSPTASATGGTINLRTRRPSDIPGITATASYGNILSDGAGDRPYYRIFGMVDSGDITGMGTTAFLSGSYTTYENPFNNYGEVEKKQFNGRILQEIGGNGDFVSVAGHYNENRNNFFGSFPVTTLIDMIEDGDKTARFYDINYPCELAEGVAGAADAANSCGTEFDRRYNPSDTGNIRASSRFTLADGLVLTVDPSYQYVKANGGGTVTGQEYACRFAAGRCQSASFTGATTPLFGYIGGAPYVGADLNGDGDMLDRVTLVAPSHTRTHRYGVISSLSYAINDQNRVRLAYTWDRANHRQTGQVGLLQDDGEPFDVFPIDDPLVDVNGTTLQKRDRQSYAILHQVSGEYRGSFMDDRLVTTIGLRAPFFTRELTQNCYTTSDRGFVDCIRPEDAAAYEAGNPSAVLPLTREYEYDKLLPSAGLVFDVTGNASVFANYSKGLSVPGTDPLYNSLFFPDVEEARPAPETTDSFDAGLRFKSGTLQAQVAGWFTRYENRLASAYDPVLERSVFRNLGQVDKYGLDASVAWQPTRNTMLYVFGSLNESEIKDNVQSGVDAAGNPVFLDTAGNRESGTPDLTFGARGQVRLGPVELGAQAKHTGKRFTTDLNDVEVDGYTLVDLDVRWNVTELPTGGTVALQANLTNLFDTFYVGGFGGGLTGTPFAQIGAPRAGSVSLIVGF